MPPAVPPPPSTTPLLLLHCCGGSSPFSPHPSPPAQAGRMEPAIGAYQNALRRLPQEPTPEMGPESMHAKVAWGVNIWRVGDRADKAVVCICMG